MGRRKKHEKFIEKHVRIPKSLADYIEAEAKRRSLSFTEVLNEILEKGVKKGDKAETEALKFIPLKYPGRCLKCQRNVEQGEWAYWGRGVGVICTDCFSERHGDRATAKLVVKRKEEEFAVKVLKKRVDVLADKFRDFNYWEILQELRDKAASWGKLLDTFFRYYKGTPEEEAKYEELRKAKDELLKVVEENREFMAKPWKKPKKKKGDQIIV